MTVVALAGGSGIFAVVLVVMFVGVVWTLFTRDGSAITERPYFNQYGGAPGATGAGSTSGHDARAPMRREPTTPAMARMKSSTMTPKMISRGFNTPPPCLAGAACAT